MPGGQGRHLRQALTEASHIDLLDVTRDAAGRLLARVLEDGGGLGAAMLRAGRAQPMEGDPPPYLCGESLDCAAHFPPIPISP